MSFSGLAPMIISGAMGGALAAVVAPKYKVAIASILGLTLGGGLLATMVFSGQFPLLGRNPLLWYWPAWLIPAFLLGGVLGKRCRNDV